MKLWDQNNQNCYLETPVVLVFHLMGVITMIYALVYSIITANYGALSYRGNVGYLLFLTCTGLFLVVIVWIAYFFHTHNRRYYQQRRIICKSVLLMLVYSVGMFSAYYLLYPPSKKEMQVYLRGSFHRDGLNSSDEIPLLVQMLQAERKCCGIHDYLDYRHPMGLILPTLTVPDSCCRSIREKCGERLNLSFPIISSVIYTNGCINKSLKEIRNTKVYFKMKLIKIFAMVPITFPLVTIVLMQVIVCLTKPKNELPHSPEDNQNRDSGSSWEKAPTEIEVVFKTLDIEANEDGEGEQPGTEHSSSDSADAVVVPKKEVKGQG